MRRRVISAIEIKTGKEFIFQSLKQTAKALGVSLGLVNKVLSDKPEYKWYKSAKGFSLMYFDQQETKSNDT